MKNEKIMDMAATLRGLLIRRIDAGQLSWGTGGRFLHARTRVELAVSSLFRYGGKIDMFLFRLRNPVIAFRLWRGQR